MKLNFKPAPAYKEWEAKTIPALKGWPSYSRGAAIWNAAVAHTMEQLAKGQHGDAAPASRQCLTPNEDSQP